jgi:putative membrane protein
MPLLSRWYAFGPFVVVLAVVWRQFGWRRALAVALGGWLIAFAAEWSSTSGPSLPFGAYSYRAAGLVHDWRLLGVPVFDSLSFTWLAFCTYTLAGGLGARGARRLLLAALAMVAIDVVVDPVALRGSHWWLGSIYSYPSGTGFWYGVSALNYVGWLVVGLVLQLWLRLWLVDRGGREHLPMVVSTALVIGVMGQSAYLAWSFGIATSAWLALALLAILAALARLWRQPRPHPPPARLVVACALRSEARAACRALGPGWERTRLAGIVRWTRAQSPGVEIWETGMGQLAAARAARQAPPSAAILVAGVGGACSPEWPLGSVGVAARVLSPEGEWLALDQASGSRLLAGGAGRSAQLGSRNAAVDDAGWRRALAAQGVDIVEMETAAWVESRPGSAAAPLAALRAVVDSSEATLGPAAQLVPLGSSTPSWARVARLLVGHPGSLSALISVGRRQRLALAALAAAVAAAVPELDQSTSSPDRAVAEGSGRR